MRTQTTARLKERLGVLASRNYALLWAGQSISAFGDKFTELAIPLLVYQLTNSTLQLGLAFIAQLTSSFFFGMVAGAMTDRWDRRRTMLVSDLLRFVLIAAIPLVVSLPVSIPLRLAGLYVLIFLISCIKQFFIPAKIATIPDLIPKDQLMSANSLDQSSMKLMEFLGYGVGGALIQMIGPTSAFLLDASSFLLSALFILLIRLPKSGASQERSKEPIWTAVAEGIRFIRGKAILTGMVILSLIAPMAMGAVSALQVVYADRVLNAGAAGFAAMEASIALGLAFGIILVGKFAKNMPRGQMLAGGVIVIGLGMLLGYGLPYLFAAGLLPGGSLVRLSLAIPFLLASAVGNGATLLAIRMIVQEFVPKPMIGRIYGVITVASSTALAVGAGTAGLADIFPVGVVLLTWAVILLISGLVAALHPAFRSLSPVEA